MDFYYHLCKKQNKTKQAKSIAAIQYGSELWGLYYSIIVILKFMKKTSDLMDTFSSPVTSFLLQFLQEDFSPSP